MIKWGEKNEKAINNLCICFSFSRFLNAISIKLSLATSSKIQAGFSRISARISVDAKRTAQ
ncbi:MAG: hypothetical protein AMJ42_05920 [Deltaproteobacteria bacterium DG_8]|nr:MAG: hypothetical protein AMJ42_05920 [Deltaproteobacteria bacterium DG_8]